MLVKSADAIMARSVIKAVKKGGDELTAMTSKTVLPFISARTEAHQPTERHQSIGHWC
jgi:hypothetical protein